MNPSTASPGSLQRAEAHAGAARRGRLRLAGGIALILVGLALTLFGAWTGHTTIRQFQLRPPPARDVAHYTGVFLLFFFAAAQVGAGLGLFGAGAALSREGARRAMYPDQPWMWRADWAAGQITYSLGRTVLIAWVAALMWNTVLWLALRPHVPLETWIENRVYVGLATVALAATLGVGLIAWAALDTWRWWRSRVSVFEMTSVPGRIGGHLDGAVRAQVALGERQAFRVRLVCEQSPGLGGTRQALWQPEYVVEGDTVAISSQYSAIPVRFEIPESCRPSTATLRNPIVWRVEVATTGPGPRYQADFRVPVFRADEGGDSGRMVQDAAADEVKVPENS